MFHEHHYHAFILSPTTVEVRQIFTDLLHFIYMATFAPLGPEPLTQGHGFSNFGIGLHEFHNHAFGISFTCVREPTIFGKLPIFAWFSYP